MYNNDMGMNQWQIGPVQSWPEPKLTRTKFGSGQDGWGQVVTLLRGYLPQQDIHHVSIYNTPVLSLIDT